MLWDYEECPGLTFIDLIKDASVQLCSNWGRTRCPKYFENQSYFFPVDDKKASPQMKINFDNEFEKRIDHSNLFSYKWKIKHLRYTESTQKMKENAYKTLNAAFSEDFVSFF